MYTNPIEEDLKQGTVHNLYLLYGDEPYLKRVYKNKLLKKLVREGDTINFASYQGHDTPEEDVLELAGTLPFFADYRVILLNDTAFFKNKHQRFTEAIKNGLPEQTVLLFLENEADKRTAAFKAAKESSQCCLIEMKMLSDRELASWIGARLNRAKKKMRRNAWEEFHTRTGKSMDMMDTEFEKLLSYVGDREEITVEDVDAICSGQAEARIFDMINGIASRDEKGVMRQYQAILESKQEDPLGILALISRQFRQLLVAKEMAAAHYNTDAIAKTSGIPPYYVNRDLRLSEKFATEDMKQLLSDAADLDRKSKTGRISSRLAVELLITKYCRK